MHSSILCPLCESVEQSFFCKKNDHHLYRCDTCRVAHVYPIPESLGDIYPETYFVKSSDEMGYGYVDYDQDKDSMKDVFLKTLEEFESLTHHRSIFDIGAATGYFLDMAKQRGWTTAGSEISPYAAKTSSSRGHEVACGDLLTLPLSLSNYGVVTMWDVFEHVPNPKAYLHRVHDVLQDGGVVLINTIDIGSVWSRLWGKRWNMIIPPEHLFYYTKNNLRSLVEGAGFEILDIRKVGKKFSLPYIFGTLYHWQGLSVWRKLSQMFDTPFWRRFAIPINLRDNICVIARK
ncbi:MAG: class I SAM-dependent methyltransferase [Candidatus Magasanikbacteria bacterium]|jgi:2-polyprenyl-3-methyl-5-hydroxy-6-metoxy-1,4-benzoquinol methylase|nr:class I SAM-dependent methyltransferase [Candidatus Magasanikbacteria bacterium]MBT4221227.1 class I SAM-dependent methyltransferase [Candidatus Magasanikbacteria bacterium]MBT4350656.1 class I SAM-dependent methyltransferase [Candidatus Magasanikbacteria bacterium]MBT4541344.1 class I SAM-dependent methyltransferase [Candidatus Magasanikbacteria bacterium]MBT6253078.1 class I SAM-dependent methyltransferase [Candidatus Magasanikbacteria bacterium]